MAIGLTSHKAQGMTIAKGEPFEKAVLDFPTSATRNTTTGLEYVMTCHIKSLTNFAIGNRVTDLDRTALLRIGTSPTNVKRCLFQERIRAQYEEVDRPRVTAEILEVDQANVKTYKDGCCFLLKWYHQKFWHHPASRQEDWPY